VISSDVVFRVRMVIDDCEKTCLWFCGDLFQQCTWQWCVPVPWCNTYFL